MQTYEMEQAFNLNFRIESKKCSYVRGCLDGNEIEFLHEISKNFSN